jgi:DNA-binding transcriptional ArsR family regulator
VVTNRSAILTALGDPTRRAIFELLADGPTAVGDLARRLPVSRPAVSQHLRVLKDVGLVVDHPSGTRHLYQLDPEGIAEVTSYFDRFWRMALGSFKSAVERETKEKCP